MEIKQLILIWTLFSVGSGFFFRWSMKSKGRTLTARTAWHTLGLLLLTCLVGWLMERYTGSSPSVVWIGRLAMLLLGVIHLSLIYFLEWPQRNGRDYRNDSLLPEGVFTVLLGLLVSICFTAAPRYIPFLEIKAVQEYSGMWDSPLVFLFPWLIFKLFDIAGQIPFRVVENPWKYPLEEVNTEHWPWRDLIRVSFKVKQSLRDEGHPFGRSTTPWIEVPREAELGKVFRLNMQEHRKFRRDTIQDLGNEYDGAPMFWWLFSIKWIWWNPTSWFRHPRFLDPDRSLAANGVRNGEIIRLHRIPREALDGVDYLAQRSRPPQDPEMTVLVNR